MVGTKSSQIFSVKMASLMDGLIVLLSVFALIVMSSFASRWKLRLKYKRLPPGPFCWPILGYVPFLDKENGHLKLTELTKKYGGVFSIYIGSRFVVVIDDFEAVKSAFSREEFMGRPVEILNLSTDLNKRSLLNMSSPVWKAHRHFWLSIFRSMSTGEKDYKPVSLVQLCSVMKKLERNKDLRVDLALELALYNITFYISFGKTFDENHDIIRQLGPYDDSVLSLFEMNAMETFFPWTKPFTKIWTKFKRSVREIEAMEHLIRKEVIEHEMTLDANNPRDFTDFFLLQLQKTKEETHILPDLVEDLKTLLTASSETIRKSLVWFVLLMAEHQEVQHKIHKELDDVVGRDRLVQLFDKSGLLMLEAAMMESMRFMNLNDINLPKRVQSDTNLCGYDIPEGTIIYHAMTSQFHNPKYWKEPDRFYPERFLSKDGKSLQIPEHFIPFSFGKRSCPGEKIARDTLFLYASNLLQKFRILPPEGGVNLEIIVNFNKGPKHPFVKFVDRH